MCDACVIKAVKDRMISRRDLFRKTAAGAAFAAVGATASAPAALAGGHDKIVDMTHELYEDFPTYSGEQQFFADQKYFYKKDGYNLFDLRLNEHTGTHMDAPLHFSADGQSVAQVPVENLVVPLCVIDIKAKASEDADAQVTPDDLMAWVSANGPIPDKACVAMNSGWDRHVGMAKFRNVGADNKMHFPGFHVEAARMLMEETGAVGMGVDTLSLDFGPSGDFATHYAWLPTNRWGLENLANLDDVPASGATLVVGSPKHRGGTGGPSRIFVMV